MLLEPPSSPNAVTGEWISSPDRPENEVVPPAPLVEAPTAAPLPCAAAKGKEEVSAKRVLLLEDDTSFREIIKEFLTETGYAVREAQSGIEGIKEVLAGDFAFILCDMQMPGLPGDLFYRAVERTRPHLCERFIFMTGHRGDVPANDFIKAASGQTLLKPFHLDKLLEAMGEMERRRHTGRETPRPQGTPTAPTPSLQSRVSSPSSAPPPSAKARDAVSAGAKRVLLIEDDSSFREVIKEFLTETGYTVREAQSGVEGIQEVLAGDFAVILCDMQMPTLAGDLFYRAVERARPQLCDRFIFMTGHRGDTAANDFIKAAGGHALLKPFHLDKLLEAIGKMERQRQLAREPLPQPGLAPSRPVQEWVSRSDSQPVTADRIAPDRPLVSPANTASRRSIIEDSSAGDGHSALRIWMNVATVLAMLAVTGLLYTWHQRAEDRRVTLSNELQSAGANWEAVSGPLEKARQDQERAEKFSESARRVIDDCSQLRWSSALQRIVAVTPARIQLQDVRLRQLGDSGDAWSLHIEARCAGTRLDVNSFRCDLQQELTTVFKYGVNARIEQMQEAPAGAAGGPAVTFTIVAAVSAAQKPIADEATGSAK